MEKSILTMMVAALLVASCGNTQTKSTASGSTFTSDEVEPKPSGPVTIPLTLEAVADGTISFLNTVDTVFYQVNDSTPIAIPGRQEEKRTDIIVKAGDKVSFYGNNERYCTLFNYDMGPIVYSNISCTSECYVYGNIMSLVNSSDYPTLNELHFEGALGGLFCNNKHIKIHPEKEFLLPATKLGKACYHSMFMGCTNLTSAPKLPAEDLGSARECYAKMFYNSGLVTSPELPAKILAPGCYYEIFAYCKNLVKAPELQATNLEENCYRNMFMGCENLTTAPELPAKTLESGCYQGMFQNCRSLNYVKCNAIEFGKYVSFGISGCLPYWLSGVSNKGTFVGKEGIDWKKAIPEGWTIEYEQ